MKQNYGHSYLIVCSNGAEISKTSKKHPFFSVNKQHSQRDITPKISLDTKSLNMIGLFWSFLVTLCEETLTKSFVGVTEHTF